MGRPHEKQKRAAEGSAVPQFVHDWVSGWPHPMQNRASDGFSVVQLEQITGSPSSPIDSKGYSEVPFSQETTPARAFEHRVDAD
jgi:hypothetical protein